MAVNYTDYIYDEREDFYNNVDYSLPDSISILVSTQSTNHEDFTSSTLYKLANSLHTLDSVFVIEGFPLLEFIINSTSVTGLWLLISWIFLPGHKDSQYWPLFVSDFYGERCSQHLFDPYSFVHFGHGIVSYHIFGQLDSYQETTITTTFHKGSKAKHRAALVAKTSSNFGLIATLFYATAAEKVENSQLIIELFRNNTGKCKM